MVDTTRPIIYLEQVGSPTEPRYIIARDGGGYWSVAAQNWVDKPREATLYVDGIEASTVCLAIQKANYKNCTHVVNLQLPVMIEVRSDAKVPLETLRVWLQRALTAQLCYGTYGNGPANGCLVLANLDFNKLRESHEQKTHGED